MGVETDRQQSGADRAPDDVRPDGAGDAEFLSIVAHLRSLDTSSLGITELRAAVRALRPIRGWVDHLDACLRTRAQQFERTTPDTSPDTSPDIDDRCTPTDDTGQVDEPIGAETLDEDSGIGTVEGRRRRARAQMITLFPDLGPLLQSGQISTEHLDALAGAIAALDPAIAARITDHADTITSEASRQSAPTLRRAVQRIAQQIATELGIERRRQQQLSTRLRHWIDGATGMGRIHAELDPDSYQRFAALLDAEVNRQLRHRGDLHPDRHRALCLIDLMEATTASGAVASDSPATLSLDVLIDLQTLLHGPHPDSICDYADGTPALIAEVRAAACISDLHPILIGGRTLPLSVGRKVRHATAAQRRALRAVYATCAIPGCATPFTRCQAHHLHPWEEGGGTDLDNLLPLCSRHHHLCHEEGWDLHLAPDRTLTVTTPDGVVQQASPDRWMSRAAPPPAATPRAGPASPDTGSANSGTGPAGPTRVRRPHPAGRRRAEGEGPTRRVDAPRVSPPPHERSVPARPPGCL